jgi:hypothetical protein
MYTLAVLHWHAILQVEVELGLSVLVSLVLLSSPLENLKGSLKVTIRIRGWIGHS